MIDYDCDNTEITHYDDSDNYHYLVIQLFAYVIRIYFVLHDGWSMT